jgi:hypothetical protein
MERTCASSSVLARTNKINEARAFAHLKAGEAKALSKASSAPTKQRLRYRTIRRRPLVRGEPLLGSSVFHWIGYRELRPPPPRRAIPSRALVSRARTHREFEMALTPLAIAVRQLAKVAREKNRARVRGLLLASGPNCVGVRLARLCAPVKLTEAAPPL